MDILKIATAGSVDDGKSTLIGRLLYDTRSVTKDRLEAVELSSQRKGLDFTDLSLLTDGLIAEREQGITIDVAHIYFSTERRKYIIADTPGHVEYTRNMITGTSNAASSIVLIDARNGVIQQTKRHLFISSLLRLETVFICINKMDLVGFDAGVYRKISEEVTELAGKIGFEGQLHFIPVAARQGDNVVHRSANMPWYKGHTLLEQLEKLEVNSNDQDRPARFPVQYVIRPHSGAHHDLRAYAGRLKSGVLQKGQEVTVLPTLKTTTIKNIFQAGQTLDRAVAGKSISIELEDDVDVSRGNMLVPSTSSFRQINSFSATVAWIDEREMTAGKTFLLQHGINTVKAKITAILGRLDIETMEEEADVNDFRMNDIGRVNIKAAKPIFADLYRDDPNNGAFILVDESNNNTVGVGFITQC